MTSLEINAAPDWVADAIFYQIFPDRFCNGDKSNDLVGVASWGDRPTRDNFFGGDLQGILDKLDYLNELGVNAIYLNPIFQARTNHRYDTTDYFKVDPALGNLELLKDLVKQAHQRGMRVIFDGVFNHCGDGFAPFLDVMEKGASSEYADWFLALDYPLRKEPLNFLTCGGCTYLPKLNYAHRPVREFILKVARYWLEETEMDGWRLDVPFKIPVDFWHEFRKVVKAVNPQAYLVGEIWREAQPWVNNGVFDGVTNYRLRDILLDYVWTNVLDGEDFGYELQTLMSQHGTAVESMLNLLDSHDTPRILTTLKGEVRLLQIALTLQMTLPGAPMVYYGDEVGLLGETDPDCRRCFPWNESQWNWQIVDSIRGLIALRKAHPAFRHGRPQTLGAFNGVYAYRQAYQNDEALVIVNPRETIPMMRIQTRSQVRCWRAYNGDKQYPVQDGNILLDEVPACSALILLPVESA